MRRIITLGSVFFFLANSSVAWGKTLVVEGTLDGTVSVRKNVTFTLKKPLDSLTYNFPIPENAGGEGTSQQISGFSSEYEPSPETTTVETDKFGNSFRKVTWKNLKEDARVNISFTAAVRSGLSARRSAAPFPMVDVPEEFRIFLKDTPLVQSNSPQIKELAVKLSAGETTQHGVVNAILNNVSDAIIYQYTPPRYDALYGLENGKGNCQNYAHLALALLRSSGIPARLVVGLTLKDQWRIPTDQKGSSLVQGMGEGLHAWIEVFFPDLGWLPCDPQQSRFFISTRHIKYGHGLDAGDVREYWQGSPDVPKFADLLDARYSKDNVLLRLRSTAKEPGKRYMVSASTLPIEPSLPVPSPVLPKPAPTSPPKVTKPTTLPSKPAPGLESPKPTIPPVKPTPGLEPPKPVKPPVKPVPELVSPKPVIPPVKPAPELESPKPVVPPVKPAPKLGMPMEIGNKEFPDLMEIYKVSGDIGTKSFERETAEYATSRNIFAQSFTLEHPLKVNSVSLAMKKFGGDGMVYLDIVADDKGKPGLAGVRSTLVSLEQIRKTPGYGWVDFPIPADIPPLQAGKYWIVLRHSGEVIMNWFYTPGKRYGGPDDTRSTARGWQWEDLLTYDFVFKVKGKVAGIGAGGANR